MRHYRPDHTPAHEMRGRTGSSILLGLIRERLVSQLSHAGHRDDLAAGAVIRVQGELREQGLVVAEAIAILTAVVTVEEASSSGLPG